MSAVDVEADPGTPELIADLPAGGYPLLLRQFRESLAWKAISIRQPIYSNGSANVPTSTQTMGNPSANPADQVVLVTVEREINVTASVDGKRRPAEQRVLEIELANRPAKIRCS